MIRRNPYSLRTRMASQFGSRIASKSFEKDFVEISKFLTNHYDAMQDSMNRVLEGHAYSAPDFQQIALSYEEKFGYPLDIEKFLLRIDAECQRATQMIVEENLLRLRSGKVPF